HDCSQPRRQAVHAPLPDGLPYSIELVEGQGIHARIRWARIPPRWSGADCHGQTQVAVAASLRITGSLAPQCPPNPEQFARIGCECFPALPKQTGTVCRRPECTRSQMLELKQAEKQQRQRSEDRWRTEAGTA